MKLSKVRINNFKSIKDSGDIHFSGSNLITILAGQNESGKTALLKALKFFQEGDYDGLDDDRRLGDGFPRVEATFVLTNNEYNTLKNITNKKIADYFKQHGFSWVRGSVRSQDYDLLKYFKLDEDIERMVNEFNNSVESGGDDTSNEKKEFNPVDFFESIRPKFVYYSSNLDKNILPNKIRINEIKSNQAVLDFQKVYHIDFSAQFEDGVNDQSRLQKASEIEQKASESLNSYWHQKIDNEKAEYSYRIQMIKDRSSREYSEVSFYVDHGNNMPLKMSQKSQGFRWFSGFILRLRAHNEDYENGNVILLIDEPGQGLHETAQKDVFNVIEEISRESGMQIFYSTHQPILLGGENLQLSRIMLTNKDENGDSTFKTVTQAINSEGVKDALSPIRSALGLITIKSFPSANKTVIVEGMSDYLIYKVFLGDDVCIIPALGADQLPNIFTILFGWGIQPRAILDGDKKGKATYNRLKNDFFETLGDDVDKYIYKNADNLELEDLIEIDDISRVLSDYNKTYDESKSKIENIQQALGKTIFAKAFHDKFIRDKDNLNEDTIQNFENINQKLQLASQNE